MTNLKDGILIGYQASAGTLVGSVTNGNATLSKSGVKREATSNQLVNRERFALVRRVISLFYPAMVVGFRNYVGGKKKLFAVMMSLIYSKESFLNLQSVQFDYSKLQLSKGILLPFSSLEYLFDKGTLKITWKKPQRDLNGDDSDLIYLVVYYPELEQMEIFSEDVRRKDQKLDFTFDQDLPASVAHCYLFIASEMTDAVSNSYYISVPNFKA